MLTWTMALAVLVLAEGSQDNICPQRDPSPGVLVLTPGREVVLHCHGDVIVDSVLKVRGKTGGPFIVTHQEAADTTSDGVHPRQPTETFIETYYETTDGTSPGISQKETEVTSTDKQNEKHRETTPGIFKRETRRASTEGESGGTSSETHQEAADTTSDGVHPRQPMETFTETYYETTDGTPPGISQKETEVTSTDKQNEKHRETTPGIFQRETRRASTEGESGGTSSETHQEAADTTSDGVHPRQPTETFTETYYETTDGTSPGISQKETEVTSTDKQNEKHRETTPGIFQRETRRASTEGESGGTSSERYRESTQGTPLTADQREVGDASENEQTATMESVSSITGQSEFSTTERPDVLAHADTTLSQPSPQTSDVAKAGAVGLKRRSFWTLNGMALPGSAEMRVLRLPHLGLKDVGNYTCYRQGALMSSVKITLGAPPVKPTLSCYRKSHESKIRCDWTSPQPIVPSPKCYLLLRKSRQLSTVACSYSVVRSRCWCVLDHEERGAWGARSVYAARLCVTNTAGNTTSPEIRFTAENSIKPDPPMSLRASGVQGGERLLGVSWTYPASWRRGFYLLRFQLRYRPSHGEKYQTVETEALSWTITDAFPDTEYELQLRAIEEFNLGHWSDWTSPVYACTWKSPESTTMADFHSLDPLWFEEGSGYDEEITTADSVVSDDSLNVFGSAFGVCVLVVMIILLSAYVFRHRMRFASKLGKLGPAPASGESSVAPPQPTSEEEKPLMSPVSPTPSQVTMQHHFPSTQEDGSHSVHFHNMGYFLVPKE
ncbi:hypothetical protein ACEWY4_019650 [Coilia grayii]|uniref:Fibronectin type-III domain-containing protein n=1 Tax=Coilia grayii TaxID=363190 RepID=A0ABD1JAI8_9TELE